MKPTDKKKTVSKSLRNCLTAFGQNNTIFQLLNFKIFKELTDFLFILDFHIPFYETSMELKRKVYCRTYFESKKMSFLLCLRRNEIKLLISISGFWSLEMCKDPYYLWNNFEILQEDWFFDW